MTDKWYLKDYKKALTARGRVMGKVQEVVIRNVLARANTRDILHLHPSEISKKEWCPRQSWYVITEQRRPAESTSFSRLNIFEEGHAIHHKWQSWLGSAGVLEGKWECGSCHHTWWGTDTTCSVCAAPNAKYREVSIFNEEHRIMGHADGIISDEKGKAVLEIKSVGVGTLRYEAPDLFGPYSRGEMTIDQLWAKIKTPLPSHIRQVSLYMYCLDIDEAVVIYEWKPTQDVKEFSIKFQPHLIESILAGCKTVKKALDNGTTVMRPAWATSSSVSTCSSCDFKTKCWSNEDADQETATDGDGEVSVEVRSPESTGGFDTSGTGSRRVVRRSTDGNL